MLYRYAFYSYVSGQYVVAENGGGSPLVANRWTAGGWETFVLTTPQTGYYTIRAVNNLYSAVQTNNVIVPGTTSVTDSTLFSFISPIPPPSSSYTNPTTASSVKFFNKAAGLYLSVNTGSVLVAGAGDQAAGITFNIIRPTTTGEVNLQNAANQQFACADNNGANPIVVNRASASGWETFYFVAQPNNAYSIQVCFSPSLFLFLSLPFSIFPFSLLFNGY